MNISSDKAWQDYNDLMNNLRQSIDKLGRKLLSVNYSSYYFESHVKGDFVSMMNPLSIIKGITRNEAGIEVIIEDSIGDSQERSLYYPKLSPEDLIGVLERLEH